MVVRNSRLAPVLSCIGFTIGVLLGGARAAGAQEPSSWFLRGAFSPAHVFATNPFESSAAGPDARVSWVPDLTIEIGRQTNGTEPWHRLYGLPSYGLGFSVAQFQADGRHGHPLEAYTFFSWPFYSINERLDVTTDFGMGVSWNWQKLNDKEGANSSVLGSNLNARIDWGFYLRYLSTSRLSVYTGIDFTHRSNGGVVQPNKGLNVLGPKVALQYRLGAEPSRHPPVARPPFRPSWELVLGGAAGVKNVLEDPGQALRQDFGVFHATAALQRHFYPFGKFAAGTDVTYDGATGAQGRVDDGVVKQWRADTGDRWAVGLFGGYEHLIARFSVFAQLGYNVARGFDDGACPRLYQRFGWRYRFTDKVWATIALRSTEGNRADFLEFGAGYRIPLQLTRRLPQHSN